jgi:signal transduction histidine kinase
MARRQGAGLMARLAQIASWPLAFKVPLLVAGLMVGIAAMISQVVLTRLASDQENNLRLLTNAYLDGLSAAILQPVLRADVWETFDALDRARSHYSGVDTRYVLVELPDGKVLAASDPGKFPVQSIVPAELKQHFSPTEDLVIDAAAGRAWLSRTLQTEGFSVGRILSEIDISELLRVRREVFFTLILVNVGLTVAFALIGYMALKRMLQPLGVLTKYVERIREGRTEPIPEPNRRRISREFAQLFDRFNAMAGALNERESLASYLAEQEKYAVLGRLASGMAHEVNNPLGGLFNALDTLRRHGGDSSVRDSTLDLLKRGLTHIRNVVRSTLVIYRREESKKSVGATDIDDLRLLVEPEAARRNIKLEWINDVRGRLPVAAGSVRQATLNLLLNACAVSPRGGIVQLRAGSEGASLKIAIADEGPGMPTALAGYLVAESPDTLPASDGLGLWIVRRLVADERGSIRVVREANFNTIVQVTWPHREEYVSQRDEEAAAVEDVVHVG